MNEVGEEHFRQMKQHVQRTMGRKENGPLKELWLRVRVGRVM